MGETKTYAEPTKGLVNSQIRKSTDSQEFGWQGLRATLPGDWELSGLSGDYNSGYIRLDDAQGTPRLELKWSQSKQKKSPDLHKVLDDYFRLVKKNLKKQTHIYIKRDVSLVKEPEFFEGRDVICFNWKGPIRAMGAIWHCQECNRIVIAQINGHLKENLRSLVVKILISIQDHPKGYTNRWSAYNLHAEVPRRYRLEKQKLMSGYLMFSFVDGSRKLVIERYGLAEMLLKEVNLEDWFRSTYRKEIRGYGFHLEPTQHDGDEALLLLGQRTRITDQIPFGAMTLIDKIARRIVLFACVWRCNISNRIYVVRVVAKREAEQTAKNVADSIVCHGKP